MESEEDWVEVRDNQCIVFEIDGLRGLCFGDEEGLKDSGQDIEFDIV